MPLDSAKAIDLFRTLPEIERRACALFCAKACGVETKELAQAIDDWLSGVNREGFTKICDNMVGSLELKLVSKWAVWASFDCGWQYDKHAPDAIVSLVPIEILVKSLSRFLCPHCQMRPDMHTPTGQCLFSPYQWK